MQAPHPLSHHDSAGAEGVEAVFHVHNVSKIYTMGEVEVQALRSVTLDLYEGEFVVLLGRTAPQSVKSLRAIERSARGY
jgi:ABC-type phosphate/phosphonate transport system ATPase subunit